MKKIAFVLTIALMFAAVLCLSVNADSEVKTPEIISQNVQYDDTFNLMYAVDASTVNLAPVTLNLYYDDPAEGSQIIRSYTASSPTTIKINGVSVSAYVFTTEGVSSKYLCNNFYVQAVDSANAKSEVVRYSVAEYMYERLYGEGQNITKNQKELYESVITFAAKAQQVLINDKEVDSSKHVTLATDYNYVSVKGGIIGESLGATKGYSAGLYPDGTEIYPFAEGIENWTVSGYDESGSAVNLTVANGSKITVYGNTAINEKMAEDISSYFGTYGGVTFNEAIYYNIIRIKTLEELNIISRANWSLSGWDTHKLVNRTDRADYIVAQYEGENLIMEYTIETENYAEGIYLHSTYSGEGDCFVFETKIKLDIDSITATNAFNQSSHHVASFSATNATPNGGASSDADPNPKGFEFARIYAAKDSADQLHYYIGQPTDDNAAVTVDKAELKEGWNTVTVELYGEAGKALYYVNGYLVGESDYSVGDTVTFEDINSVRIAMRNAVIDNSTIYFDDMFLGKVNKEYTAKQ